MFKALLTTILLLVTTTSYAFDVKVRQVHDGDTILVESTALPFPLSHMSIRLRGIDTPELKGQCKAEKTKAKLATNYLKSYIKPGEILTLQNFKWDKYGGRIDADVYHKGDKLSDIIIAAGYAVAYTGHGAKNDWCKK